MSLGAEHKGNTAGVCAGAAGKTTEENAATLNALLETFYDRDSAGKERVIEAFRRAADQASYPLLETALRNNENDRMRNASMEIYVALQGRSVPFLAALLKDANEEVRTFSAVMLGTIKDSAAVPALIKALADSDMNVKHAAAEALGKIGDRRSVEPLILVLSTDMWLQFPAAIALGDIGDSRAIAPLVDLLSIPGANVPAIQALGKLAHPEALKHLMVFLDHDEAGLREWALEAVVETLSRNCSSMNVPVLSSRAKQRLIGSLMHDLDRPGVRKNAAIALGYFHVQEAVPALRNLLNDTELGEPAQMSLSRIGTN